jgi:hypothetical protein
MSRRLVVRAAIALAVVGLIVVGEGLTGAYDKYFTVSLVNRTGRPVVVDNHGDLFRVASGRTDKEWGSSTARQPLLLRAGRLHGCVDLFLPRQPARPLAIHIRNGRLAVNEAPPC